MKKIFLLVVLTVIALFVLAACDDGDNENNGNNQENGGAAAEMGEHEMEKPLIGGMGEIFDAVFDVPQVPDATPDQLDGTIYERLLERPAVTYQLTALTPGEELLVLHTNHGDITLRFFPEEAPLAVENFKTLARDGFYDGLIFHRVMEGFMIQGGCPEGTGRGGSSIFPEGLGLERSFNLHHFRGALATAHRGPGRTIGSQFYIVHAPMIPANMAQYFNMLMGIQDNIAGEFSGERHIYVRDVLPADALEHFIRRGGTPWLDWQWNPDGYGHTVFGHVVEGLDIVDEIASVAVNPADSRPFENVVIERVSFIIYGE